MDMVTVEGRRALPCINQEIPFSFEELFFSRTDHRGVILSGNSVFQRISMYSWDELINKPHSIIRHPDMPRAVFWLLWETIKKGQPIGAYVKNRAKDGRYYWVFAIVTPIEDGSYLSVRLKPSALLSVVEGEYKALTALATKEKLKPADAGVILLGRLKELGFDDYPAFMAAALSAEMATRDRQLGRQPDRMLAFFDALVEAAKSLIDRAQLIFNAYAGVRHVPLNLNIQAAQLGGDGAAIGVISNSYHLISNEIKDNLSVFVDSARKVLSTINDGRFLICIAKVQREIADFFRNETSDNALTQEQELNLLEQQQSAYQRKAVEGLRAIKNQAGHFQRDCLEMKRLATSLEVTRIMGKMESSRLTARDGLDKLIDELDSFQVAIGQGLKEIDRANHCIQQNARQMLNLVGVHA
jgi:aerotaxis receptor